MGFFPKITFRDVFLVLRLGRFSQTRTCGNVRLQLNGRFISDAYVYFFIHLSEVHFWILRWDDWLQRTGRWRYHVQFGSRLQVSLLGQLYKIRKRDYFSLGGNGCFDSHFAPLHGFYCSSTVFTFVIGPWPLRNIIFVLLDIHVILRRGHFEWWRLLL